jgi:hypothetical protein
MVTTATFFSPPRVRRRGGVAMPGLEEDPSPGGNRPAAALLPELYAELRRLTGLSDLDLTSDGVLGRFRIHSGEPPVPGHGGAAGGLVGEHREGIRDQGGGVLQDRRSDRPSARSWRVSRASQEVGWSRLRWAPRLRPRWSPDPFSFAAGSLHRRDHHGGNMGGLLHRGSGRRAAQEPPPTRLPSGGRNWLILPQDNMKMGASDGHDREIFFADLVRR